MATWNQTKVSTGGPALLPPGTRNFTMVSATPQVNEYTGRRQIVFTMNSVEGGGKVEVDLEADAQYQDIVNGIIKSCAMALGFEPTNGDADLHQVILPEFIQKLPTLAGTVVELNVVHSEYQRKGKDGFPMVDEATGQPVMGKRQKVYWNKLVQRGNGAPQAAAPVTPAGFSPSDFQPVPNTPDEDIPFD